jgi:hypothetical protein
VSGSNVPSFRYYFTAVAEATSIDCGRTTFHKLAQHVVQQPYEPFCLSMMSLFELFHLFAVTAAQQFRVTITAIRLP